LLTGLFSLSVVLGLATSALQQIVPSQRRFGLV